MTEKKKTTSLPVVFKDLKDQRKLARFLSEKGYQNYCERFWPSSGFKDGIRVIWIKIKEKVYFHPTVTTMACWCSGRRYPLNVDEFISYYDQMIEEGDVDLFDELVRKKCEEKPERKRNGLYRI